MTIFQRKRLAAGLSQTQIAKRLGVDPSTVSRWETSDCVPLPELFPRLAEFFGISAEEATHLFDESPQQSVAPTTETSAA